jgi:hypothetical protein
MMASYEMTGRVEKTQHLPAEKLFGVPALTTARR